MKADKEGEEGGTKSKTGMNRWWHPLNGVLQDFQRFKSDIQLVLAPQKMDKNTFIEVSRGKDLL